ncbi:hypothetical protein Efla_007089 [Eimeria flavescens]
MKEDPGEVDEQSSKRLPCEDSSKDHLEGQQLSRHAFHSTWEDIYQRELQAAAARRRYSRGIDASSRATEGAGSSRSSSRDSSQRSGSSEGTFVDGEEWFGPECAKIASWVCNILRKAEKHPLEPYFQLLRTLHSNKDKGSTTSEGNDCAGGLEASSQNYLSLPILDVGCGGGQFLARLQRRGFRRLAGIDYSASAVRLAAANLLRAKAKKGKRSACHVCLRQADLRHLEPGAAPVAHLKSLDLCICCCSETSVICDISCWPKDGSSDGVARHQQNSCACEPLRSLPPFPVFFDKGTFDVFWLMRAPEVYVQSMHRVMPQYAILFLTSCNCTLEELDSHFCLLEGGQPREQACGAKTSEKNVLPSSMPHQRCPSSGVLEGHRQAGGNSSSSVSDGLPVHNTTSIPPSLSPMFERIDMLPHRSFKFGGVEGQFCMFFPLFFKAPLVCFEQALAGKEGEHAVLTLWLRFTNTLTIGLALAALELDAAHRERLPEPQKDQRAFHGFAKELNAWERTTFGGSRG